MNTEGNPCCPKCVKRMTRAMVELHYTEKTSKETHKGVWLCDKAMGGCGEQIPYTPRRR